MMRPRSYHILQRAVEEGVARGYNRAHKHADTPDSDTIQSHIVDSVLLEITEVFGFDDPE